MSIKDPFWILNYACGETPPMRSDDEEIRMYRKFLKHWKRITQNSNPRVIVGGILIEGNRGVYTPTNDNTIMDSFITGSGVTLGLNPVDDSERCTIRITIPEFQLETWLKQIRESRGTS